MNQVKTVMIIDDDEDDRQLFFDAVSEIDKSIRCFGASNGEEALRLLNGETITLPDFIFLDLNMPRLNGKRFLAQIKKVQALCHIPVVIYSTSRRAEDVEETKKLGAAYFLTKPALFDEIGKSIARVLKGNW